MLKSAGILNNFHSPLCLGSNRTNLRIWELAFSPSPLFKWRTNQTLIGFNILMCTLNINNLHTHPDAIMWIVKSGFIHSVHSLPLHGFPLAPMCLGYTSVYLLPAFPFGWPHLRVDCILPSINDSSSMIVMYRLFDSTSSSTIWWVWKTNIMAFIHKGYNDTNFGLFCDHQYIYELG